MSPFALGPLDPTGRFLFPSALLDVLFGEVGLRLIGCFDSAPFVTAVGADGSGTFEITTDHVVDTGALTQAAAALPVESAVATRSTK